jgi:oxygen-dependent protoporphyrinogen oxidase
MAAEYFLPPSPARPGADESIASFIARRFGREALERLGEPLLAGIHGGDADRLSMRALFPRFIDLEQSDGSVIRGLRRLRPKSAGVPPAPFVSIRGGTNTLVNALVGSLPPASLMADVSVTALEWRGGWRVHLTTGRHLDVPAVLLATPPRAIANLVEHVDAELSGLFAYLKDVSLITVALGYRCYDGNLPLAGSGFVVPKSEHATVNAVTWVSSKWTERAPGDHILLRASVGGARNPNASLWSNTDILTRVREDVRRYLGVSCAPVFSRVYRMPHAGVLLEVGHLDLVEKIQARLDASSGLFVSAAGVRGVGIADCVGDARAQAVAMAEYVRCKERHSCSVQIVRRR